MKLFGILSLIIMLTSCVGSSNRSGSRALGSGFVSSYDVTLLSESACICKQGNPLTNINANCFSVCESKPSTPEDTLFLDTFLGPAIELNPQLGNLNNWCRAERQVGNDIIANPECRLLAKNSRGEVRELEITLNGGSPNFSVNVQALNFDETYIISLIETVSGNSSNSIQIRKERSNSDALGNLNRIGISDYECLVSPGGGITPYEVTYYFGVVPPLSVPAAVQGITCNIDNNGDGFDSPIDPRRGLTTNQFFLWSPNDPRFYDNDGDNFIDVHDRIIDSTNISDIEIFLSLDWNREPPQAQPDNNSEESEEKPLGFMLAPFVYSSTHPQFPLQSYCPGNEEYASDDPLFRELGFMIGVETEGIYIGRRNQQSQINSDGETVSISANNILINESTLKRIWFTIDSNGNEVPIQSEDNIRNFTTYFYWPEQFVGQDPYQPLGRSLYQVISGSSGSGAAPTHDKKIGCIPSSL